MAYLTVCTPTYNRAYTLRRPFESLLRQTFKDFEWLIIDDGSSDNTESLVKEFIEQADFPIKYVHKPNGGRASALNESYQHIRTEYVINLDSDDELVPDALEKIYHAWENIPENERDRFWCVVGHCVDQHGNRIGGDWPENINERKGKSQHKIITCHKGGEKSCCRKTSVLRQYPFPQYPDTNFVPENIVWEKINQKFDQYCVNEVFRVYHTGTSDSLTSGRNFNKIRRISYYYLSLFYLNECFGQVTYNKTVRRAFLDVSRCAILIGRKYCHVMSDINKWYKKMLVSIFWPLMWAFVKVYYRR